MLRVRILAGHACISSLPYPDQLRDQISLLCNGYGGLYTRGSSDQRMKLTTQLHLVLKLITRGALTPLTNVFMVLYLGTERTLTTIHIITFHMKCPRSYQSTIAFKLTEHLHSRCYFLGILVY